MNWRKLKKVLIPLLIIKVLIFVFFIFKSDLVSISREINYNQQGIENGSVAPEKQKLIRIVRNENDRGITIKLRSRKNASPFREREQSDLIID